MKAIVRWGKFSAVGAVGMAVQLIALAGFNRLLRGHYLWASGAALELTLVHNFVWHWHYTWRDRRDHSPWFRQFMRFHLSNGLVSLLGNLVLMRLLVHGAHLPVLVANVVAIACCSVANFWLGDLWAFARQGTAAKLSGVAPSRVTAAGVGRWVVMLLLLSGVAARGQAATQEPGFVMDCAYGNIFAGPAVAAGGSSVRPTFTGGVTFGQYSAKPLGKGVGTAGQFELGVIGPLPGGYPLDGLFSFNEMLANKVPYRSVYPFVTGGYSRLYATGNAVNFGLGVDLGRVKDARMLRVELRDYYLFTGPRQHVIGLRIGWGKVIAD